jgi:hypothetical protein
MVCSIDRIPNYIDMMNISDDLKMYTRNVHNNIVNELMNLKNKDDKSIFVKGRLMEYNVTEINPNIDQEEAIRIANQKINELNGRYKDSIKLLNSVGRNVLAVNATNFGEFINKTRNKNLEMNFLDTSNYLNFEAHADQVIEESVRYNILNFLNKLGVNTEEVDEIQNGLNPRAVADLSKKLIQYITGEEDKLTEEAAHFLTMLLPKDHPILAEAMAQIINEPIYSDVLEEYGKLENYNDEKLKHEAIGKLVAQRVKELKGEVSKINNSTWIGRLINNALSWIKNLFEYKKTQNDDVFDDLAYRLLNEDISDLSFENVQSSVAADGIFFNVQFDRIIDNLEKSGEKEQIYNQIKSLYKDLSDLKSQYKRTQKEAESKQFESVDKVLQFIQSSIRAMENTPKNVVNTFVDLVFNTEAVLSDFEKEKDAIALITDPNAKLLRLNQLYLSTRLLNENIVPQIRKVGGYLSENDLLYNKIGNVLRLSGNIDDYIKREWEKIILKIFPERFKGAYTALETKHNEKMATLNENLNQAKKQNDTKRVKFLESKIKAENDNFRKFAPSEERIQNEILGLGGDASTFSYWLEAAGMNSNIVIAELDNMIQEAINNRYDNLQAILNKSQEEIEKYKKKTGLSPSDMKAFYGKLVEKVALFDGYDEEGKPKFRYQKALINEHDKSYIAQQQVMVNEIVAKNKEIFNEKDRSKVDELKKELNALWNKKKKWDRENMEMEYTPEYYNVDALLDKDLGNGVTARSMTDDIYEQLNIQYQSLKYATDSIFIDQIYDTIDELNTDLRNLKDETNKTGINLKIAQQLNKYSEEMKKIREYKITEKSKANHQKYLLELERRLNNGEIDEKAYNILVERSYSEEFSKEYWDKKKELSSALDALMQNVSFRQGNKAKQDEIFNLYKDISNISNKYRDELNEVDANRIPPSELKIIKEKELEIEKIKDQLVKFSGLSVDEMREVNKIYAQLSLESDRETRNELRMRLTELLQRGENQQVDPNLKNSIMKVLNDLKELTESVDTDYYKAMIERKLSEIDVPEIDKSSVFTYKDISYIFDGEKWVAQVEDPFGEIEKLDDAVVNSIYQNQLRREKLEATEWFQENHVYKKVFVNNQYEEVAVPLSIWRKSRPVDSSLIVKTPAFKFRERIVNEKYLNKNYRNTIDGYNIPKKGKFVNENYSKLTAPEKEFLEFMRKMYHDIQVEKIPIGKRLGDFLPSIEKSSFERITEYNIASLGKSIKSLKEGIKRKFKGNEQDEDIYIGKFNDDILGEMPVLFSGQIDAENQTDDLLSAILTYTGYAMRYDALQEIKPVATALLSVVSDPNNKPVTNRTKNLIEKFINFKKEYIPTKNDKIQGQSTMQKHVEELIRKWFYHETQYDEKLGKFANQAMSFAASTTLGGTRVIGNLKNNIAGKIQMSLLATLMKNSVYSQSNLAYAQMKSFTILKDLVNDNMKAGDLSFYHQLLNKFDAFQGTFYNEYGQKISASLLREATQFKKYFMILKNTAEVEMQVINAFAILDNIKIEHEGKMIPLHQAFELKNGLLTAKDGIDAEKMKEKISEGLKKVKYANIVTNGNYNKMDSVVAEKYALGRLFLFMNKYFVPMAMFRFAPTQYNVLLNEITTGYQRQFVQTLYRDIKAGYYVPFAHMIANPDDYTKEELRAAYTTIQEGLSLAILALAVSLMGGTDPDRFQKLEADPNGYWKAQILSLILSVKLETETMHPFYGNDNIAQKLKSPFPVARLYENVTKLIHTLDFGDEDFYKRDTGIFKKGDYKGIALMIKILGLESNIMEVTNPIERLKRIEQSQFIRQ